MKFLHRVAFHARPEQAAEIAALGIEFKIDPKAGRRYPFLVMDADEGHPNWPLFCVLLRQWGEKPGPVHTEFTQQEVDSSPWLTIGAWPTGFPQPQDFETFIARTYERPGCNTCRFGEVQKYPIRLKSERKWGRHGIMSLHWLSDELFVPPHVWESIFKPWGIGCRPVCKRGGAELKTVVQLVIEETVDVVTDGLDTIACPECGRLSYSWHGRGPFPPLVNEPQRPLVKTNQTWGSGWAPQTILIRQDLARVLKSHDVRGASYAPVQSALPVVVA